MKTILLVDDDQELRTLFGRVLRRGGYSVIEADSGVKGLEMARKHLPDLILSDINMAGGDGVSLLRDIRRDPELKSRQFVFLSGTTDWGSLRNSVEERADDFLTKPVSFQALLNCMTVRFRCSSISWRAEGQMLGPDPLLDAA
jgi:CheY-like chemotaxis protein